MVYCRHRISLLRNEARGFLYLKNVMNTLQFIQNAENEAGETIKKAEKEAFNIISHTQKEVEREISTLKKELRENALQKTEEQKASLAKLYKEIIKKGKKEAEKITEKTAINKKEATRFILDNFVI